MNNIILIGFMGVGKGSVAREISRQSQIMCIDTDDLIESWQNMPIKKIFAMHGEEYFRVLEKNMAKWLEYNVKKTLISTGGGFFKVGNIHKIGTVVLLDSPFDKIYERLLKHENAEKKLKKRPLFQDVVKAKSLYKDRKKEYKKIADIIIDVSDRDLADTAKEICKRTGI